MIFRLKKNFLIKNLSMDEIIKHLAVFVSHLWQIHIFSEGNTRAPAVFFIKYLRTLGFGVTNDIFAENAWYFRNALVRANYTNLKIGVHETIEYLELFSRNLLLGENNPLKNRDMHISGSLSSPKCNEQNENCTLNCTLEEMAVLNLVKADGKLTQKKISESIKNSKEPLKQSPLLLKRRG